MTRKYMRSSVLVIVLALLAACSGSPAAPGTAASTTAATGSAPANGGEQINVVATTSIIADLALNVGGERVNITTLLPPGSDPHSYAPTPRDAETIAQAQIVFENGLGLEEWLEELITNAGGERPVVAASDGITPLAAGEHAHEDEAAAASDAAENDHNADPHMWLDVQHTIRYVENIRDGLKNVDAAGSAAYDQNAAAYIAQLQQLDGEITEQVEQIPPERRKLITNHDTWGYFAERYGFEVVGTVFEGVSTEQEPSAQQIAALVRDIQAQNVPAVFAENTVNVRLAEQIADEAGVQVVTDLYTDALGEPGSSGATYIDMMRHNAARITAALR